MVHKTVKNTPLQNYDVRCVQFGSLSPPTSVIFWWNTWYCIFSYICIFFSPFDYTLDIRTELFIPWILKLHFKNTVRHLHFSHVSEAFFFPKQHLMRYFANTYPLLCIKPETFQLHYHHTNHNAELPPQWKMNYILFVSKQNICEVNILNFWIIMSWKSGWVEWMNGTPASLNTPGWTRHLIPNCCSGAAQWATV